MTSKTSPKVTLKMPVWAAVRNTPGMSSRDVWNKFPSDGQSTISSILSTLDFSNVIYSTKTNGETIKRYYTDYEVYPSKEVLKRIEPSNKPAVKTTEVVDTYTVNLLVPPVPQKDDPIEELFNTLSLNESRQLYKRLQSIFGLEAVC